MPAQHDGLREAPRGSGRSRIPARTALLLGALLQTSCFLDPEPALPGFPGSLMATVPLDTLGLLGSCIQTTDGALLVAGSEGAAAVSLEDGKVLGILPTVSAVCDLGDTDAAGYAWLLTDDRLIPVSLGTWELQTPVPVGTGSLHLTVSAESGRAWVVDQSDVIREIDLASGTVETIPGTLVHDCLGLVCSADGSALFAADGAAMAVVKLGTSSWTPEGRLDLGARAIDLFRGPPGRVCCIVEGSNEIWTIDEASCTLVAMATIPAEPVAAAVMPDGSFSYASCPGPGLVVVAENGQIEFRSTEFGLPTSIAIRGDGERTALCCPDEGVVRILE